MRDPFSQADPARGNPTLPGSPEPQRPLAGSCLLPPSLMLLEHLGPDGHRSEGPCPDSAGDTTATTQGRGTGLAVPRVGPLSLTAGSGALSPSSLVVQ